MAASVSLSCHSCGTPYCFPQPSVHHISNLPTALTASNDPVSDTDAELVREQILPIALTGISTVEKQLEQLNAMIANMEVERSRLKTIVSRSRSLLSPFRRFPVECMSEIFQWYCTMQPTYEFDVFNTSKGPWLLTHVCRLWRNIALAHPPLWSTITIFKYSIYSGTSNWKDTIATRISLTKSHPLSFDLNFGLADSDEHIQRNQEYLGLAMQHSERWKHFRLAVDVTSRCNTFGMLSAVSGKLPLLQCLGVSVDAPRYGAFEPNDALITMFQNAPSLRMVELAHCNRTDIRLPLAQLTEVKTVSSREDISMRDTIRFISDCPLLRSLTINTTAWHDDIEEQIPSKVLTSPLRYLDVDMVHWALWRYVRNPLLEELHATGDHDINDVFEFLRHSRSLGLKRLTLRGLGGSTTVDNVLTLLDLAPALEELSLRGIDDGDDDVGDCESPEYSLLKREWIAEKDFGALVSGLAEPAFRGRSRSLRWVTVDMGWANWSRKVQYS